MAAQWTWLVYMAGDNNLEGAGRQDLKEMMQVGSTAGVNVLVEFDTEEKKAYRYRVEKGKLATLATLPGINTGDPKYLTDFIAWGAKTAPADHYALVVWNHGGGFEDGDFDYDAMRSMRPRTVARRMRANRALFRTTRDELARRPPMEKAIAIDVGSRDYLDNQELRRAVANGGVHFDVFGCDACLMNMLEIAYEMRGVASVMVGSEESEPGPGWPYADILAKLTKNPAMTANVLGKNIVDAFAAWYKAHGNARQDGAATLAALDLTRLASVTAPVQKLGDELTKSMDAGRAAIAMAAQGALTFDNHDYIDLGDFANRLGHYLPAGSASAGAAKAVSDALAPSQGFVIENGWWGPHMARAHGVSICFPSPKGDMDPSDLLADYARLQFAHDFPGWKTMIAAYQNALKV